MSQENKEFDDPLNIIGYNNSLPTNSIYPKHIVNWMRCHKCGQIGDSYVQLKHYFSCGWVYCNNHKTFFIENATRFMINAIKTHNYHEICIPIDIFVNYDNKVKLNIPRSNTTPSKGGLNTQSYSLFYLEGKCDDLYVSVYFNHESRGNLIKCVKFSQLCELNKDIFNVIKKPKKKKWVTFELWNMMVNILQNHTNNMFTIVDQ